MNTHRAFRTCLAYAKCSISLSLLLFLKLAREQPYLLLYPFCGRLLGKVQEAWHWGNEVTLLSHYIPCTPPEACFGQAPKSSRGRWLLECGMSWASQGCISKFQKRVREGDSRAWLSLIQPKLDAVSPFVPHNMTSRERTAKNILNSISLPPL